jgi:FKBP-type peptidyl-prolyl cis-trans isomerase SlyD
MTISKDTVVAMTYVLTNAKGEIVDESGDAPFHYLQGHENIVPGLERALEGLAVGASKSVAVSPADGYGEYDPKLKFEVPRSKMGNEELPVDAMVQLQDGAGHHMLARVVESDAVRVVLDANHPLAGETLNFQVTIIEVRAALPDELAHGHVHGPGCHHHH